jgi:hypothetical protein
MAASNPRFAGGKPIRLPVPLEAFPWTVGEWTGTDVPIAEAIQRVAGYDDQINRLYVNRSRNQWVNLFAAYSARPRTMIGHRPEVCYVGGGWIHDGTDRVKLNLNSGRNIPALIHRFHKPKPKAESIVVLSFYVVNGHITDDERVFTGLNWRTPNIGDNPARYVAQVQISSVLENSARAAAAELTDPLKAFFPDQNGQVSASRYLPARKRPTKGSE